MAARDEASDTVRRMTNAIETPSPFEALRRVDDRGEFWLAREMVEPLGYERWARFEPVMDRAISACRNTGGDPAEHMHVVSTMQPIGNGAHRAVSDHRLTRFGAYLVAMNGDPRKPEVAAAQAYFAIKTREAEVGMSAGPLNEFDILRAAIDRIEATRRAASKAQETADVAHSRIDAIEVRHGWFSALGYALSHQHRSEARYLARVGKRAATIARNRGVEPVKTEHEHFGAVNLLPADLWEQAFSQVGP